MNNLKLLKRKYLSIIEGTSIGNFSKVEKQKESLIEIVSKDPTNPICILVHSWLGNSNEMEQIKEMLIKNGISVLSLNLLGHGTKPEDLIHFTAEDWQKQLRQEVGSLLHKGFWNIYLLGQCGGGNVILNYLNQKENKADLKYIKGIILASVPSIFNHEIDNLSKLYNLYYRFAIRPLFHIIPKHLFAKRMIQNRTISDEENNSNGYNQCFPLLATAEGVELVRKSAKVNLNNIKCPALIFHYSNDFYYSTNHAKNLYNNINSSSGNKLVLLKSDKIGPINSHHIINKPQLIELIQENLIPFINKNRFK